MPLQPRRKTKKYGCHGCDKRFNSWHGLRYHQSRYCGGEEELGSSTENSGIENSGMGESLDGISQLEEQAQDEGSSELLRGEEIRSYEQDPEDDDSNSFDEVHNFTTRELLESKLCLPDMVDDNGNPTPAGFYLFVQTVEQTRQLAEHRVTGGQSYSIKESILTFMAIVTEW